MPGMMTPMHAGGAGGGGTYHGSSGVAAQVRAATAAQNRDRTRKHSPTGDITEDLIGPIEEETSPEDL
jgi:hypothetical protein